MSEEERYRGNSLIRNSAHLNPYGRTMPRTLWKPWGRGLFLTKRREPVGGGVRINPENARMSGRHGVQYEVPISLQRYLAHKKLPPPRTLQWAYA